MDKHRAGQHEDARRLYLEHLETQPDDAAALCLLASLAGEQGDHAGAEASFRRAIGADAGHAPAHAGLGASLLLQQRPGEAAEALDRAIGLQPDQPEWRLQLALALRQSGRLEEAIRVVARMVKRWPDNLQGRYNLAVLALEGGNPDLAAENFRFVLQRQPDRLAALVGLGRALIGANDPAGAQEALDGAARLAPDDAEVNALRGNLLRRRGRFEDAISSYRKALDTDPGHVGATVGLADIDRHRGDADRGLQRLAPLLEAAPSPQAMITAARLMLRSDRLEETVRAIEKWLELPGVSATSRSGLLSLKGHALDRLGQHEAAWTAWTESHGDLPRHFDGQHFDKAIDALCEAYEPALFAGRSIAPVSNDPRPLLIVGTPRSGKSILEQMLACHPAVHGAGELRYLGVMTNHLVGMTGGAAYPGCVRALSEGDVRALSDSYSRALEAIARGARWVTDTQPTNFLHIGLASLVAPGLKVVFCERDPLDTAWACYGRRFADPALAFVATPQGIGRYLAGMRRIMRHWAQAVPIEIMTVRYEDLVRRTRPTIEGVLSHIGLEWDDACADYAHPGAADLDAAPVLTGAVDDREIGRGIPYRHHLARVEAILSGSADAG
jgi:tetratricopeptide (TPR) repeat protein